MKKKLRVGVLFGGRSGEHEVSLLSAASILKAIDPKKYEVVPIGIDKQGRWLTDGYAQRLLTGQPAVPSGIAAHAHDHTDNPVEGDPEFSGAAAVLRSGEEVNIPALPAHLTQKGGDKTINLSASADLAQPAGTLATKLDVIFPVLHGTFGEDGTIQGLLELADLAYVGSGVLGSAAGMDKDVMKKLFGAAGLPQTPYLTLTRGEWKADPKRCQKAIEKKLSYPLFVKPANLGSSVGISKVHDRSELAAAMDLAAGFDRKLVIEEGVGGPGAKPRELEVAVLGNDAPEASVVGEIVPNREFYDYESKYADSPEDPSVPIIPAELTKSELKQIQAMAIAAFKACDCAGLARVDFLKEPGRKGRIYLNEINTMPGFTSISMYPKLWEASGLKYKALIDRLIVLARERHAEKMATSFSK
ncbi:D-alanine-D-alanine ligase [Granulicella rosea]|uniref:D-alanine--D-alanine ligase n=1 Tax=Granulicella rosea TaxID=474952 RepID=A0A239LQZ0_9BACT|nr:D-alanine--D-alanine ligase family protein [Granulicella rosea]SNT32288.1 D-alanine-D-alanine ligase [Granulicella rosea]